MPRVFAKACNTPESERQKAIDMLRYPVSSFLSVLLLCAVLPVVAQQQNDKPKRDWGKLSGSVESSWGVYMKDKVLGIDEVEQSYGTNTYINLNYAIKGFRFGLQYDIYEKPMLGFDANLEGNGLRGGFAAWSNSRWDITLGTFYDQFGSGLIFRAYEEREMGINTSLAGANIHWQPTDWLSTKILAGMPRRFMTFADSWVYGVDVELALLQALVPSSDAALQIGGSWVLRDDRSDNRKTDAPAAVSAFSGRLDFTKGAFSLGGEWVSKGESMRLDPEAGIVDTGTGRALLLNAGLDLPGFGISATWRSIENMSWRQDDSSDPSMNLNYIPALTKQHKYALCSLFPHEVHDFGGETGGQIDVFGEIPVGSNPRRPLRFAVNASMYRNMERNGDTYRFMGFGGDLLFAEAGLELEKKWGPDWKTIVAGTWQRHPEASRYGFGTMEMNTQIVVGDVLWQMTPKTSLRVELQHAWSDSKDDQRWAMGLVELGFAPSWMVYISDMCNYKSYGDNIHYYDAGVSYARKFLRAQLSYGRHRAGETCSGGICRYVPEYTGFNIEVSIIL